MQAAFDSLAPFVQEFIYRQSWKELRLLQVEAVQAVMNSAQDVLITTGTASGKTEAAFLPVISLISHAPIGSVKVLYVGPLKALINDQFRRLEPLCEQGGIPIHRWHGDVAANQKSDLIDNPGGVLQITPESIESLLINKTKSLHRLFSGLEFIVVDEVHTFLESDRGLQLQSQLERLSAYSAQRPRRIGLSATVGDVEVAKRWLNYNSSELVTLINPKVELPSASLSHLHFISSKPEIHPDLLDDLYLLTRNRRSLIFCNTRDQVEQVTAQLNHRCRRDYLDERYLPHHGSISKDIREDAESKMRDGSRPYSVVCTNTLELGIDIGQLELTVQIDSTHSVMSFVQRLGRTGRKFGESRIMQIYSSELTSEPNDSFFNRFPFSLLKATAIVNLFLQGWVEPPALSTYPYHILYHQILSLLIERNESTPKDLVNAFYCKGIFSNVSLDDFDLLLKHLVKIGHVEMLESGEMILGLEGEKVARSRDFYAVFQAPPEWDVVYVDKNIGRISPHPDLMSGVRLMLGGRLWEVTAIYPEQKQVIVKQAKNATATLFSGTGVPEMHPRIGQEVFKLLCDSNEPVYIGPEGITRLQQARSLFSEMDLNNHNYVDGMDEWILFPWTGTRIARTLQLYIQRVGFCAEFAPFLFPWVLIIQKPEAGMHWKDFIARLNSEALGIEDGFELVTEMRIELLQTHKYDQYLPELLIRKRAAYEWIDWENTKDCINKIV
ncbi:MAG: DEAD/DEAH box helicase [Pelolinea sp.]|nr:DEAD/DEAH box helicase [Pelolinea sp.]